MLNLIYDATVLLNDGKKNAARSGIFFCCKRVFDELCNAENVKVRLYFSPEKLLDAMPYIKECGLECVNALPNRSVLLWINRFFWKCHAKFYHREKVRKPFALGILFSQKLVSFFYRSKYKESLIYESDVFFSPAKEIPVSIRKYEHLSFYTILYDAIPLMSNYMGMIETSIYRRLIRSFGSKDRFFCISNQTKKDFIKISEKVTESNAFVIPLAAPKKFVVNQDSEEFKRVSIKYAIPAKKYVFSLCTIEPRKNLIRAVESFLKFIEKNNINDIVWIMGGGHWDSFVKQLNRKGICWNDQVVKKIGYVDDDDLPILYSNAEWFVYTSQYEGFGLPPLEAMQCGCPVIVSNNSSLPEVVGDAGILIDWDSDERHVAAYEKYYFDKKFRDMKATEGLERAKQFSWKKSVDQMVDVMNKII